MVGIAATNLAIAIGNNYDISSIAAGIITLKTRVNDYVAVTDSVNQGIPVLRLSRTSAVARSLVELVELVTAKRAAESKGLFDRLFGRGDSDL